MRRQKRTYKEDRERLVHLRELKAERKHRQYNRQSKNWMQFSRDHEREAA